ncbi:TIGR03503 family protein [Catenovulum sp. SX2]|uniref:TIGR03503 family protein n=1 Tax=Catenovulum sp. SX2 TaxID=3398614 RepID=UPI003F872F37
MKRHSGFILFVTLLLAFNVSSNEQAMVSIDIPTPGNVALDAVKNLNLPKHLSGIQLIDNRFRIDAHTKEIVMVLFRKKGSPPVILIRPDGSKIYAPMITPEQGQWFDDSNFDMIRLKDPMVGPWQAVGKIESGSKIMVLSDVKLKAEPLPQVIFSGETIKLTAHLLNGGKPIDYADFSDVVKLDVTFTSTNNSNYDNFGADAEKVATFKDDGQGFDERRKDGTFTGEFKLNITSGEWQPSLFIDLALFNRELLLDPIIVEAVPFILSADKAIEADQKHVFHIEPASSLIDFSTFAFSGEIFYPNGEAEKFAMTESTEGKQSFPLFNYADGVYKIKVFAFGKNANGRDMMIDVPEFTFNVAPLPVEIDESALIPVEQAVENLPEEAEKAKEPEGLSPSMLILLVILGNLVVLLIAFSIYWFVFRKGNKTPARKSKGKFKFNWKFWQRDKKASNEMELPEQHAVDKISSEPDDIIDLTLPDET